jgi:hypothetical protein
MTSIPAIAARLHARLAWGHGLAIPRRRAAYAC